MNISRSLLLLVGVTCVFALSVAAQLLIKQETLADGIVVQIIGEGMLHHPDMEERKS